MKIVATFFTLLGQTLTILFVLPQVFTSPGTLAADTILVHNGTHLEQLLCGQDARQLNNTALILQHDTVYEMDPGEFCVVQHVTNLTIRSADANESTSDGLATIQCVYNSFLSTFSRGFGFLWAHNLWVENVAFEYCGGVISSDALDQVNNTDSTFYFKPNVKAVLLLNSCYNCQIKNVTITQHIGYGIVGMNNGDGIVLDRVTIENNYVYNCVYSASSVCKNFSIHDHSEGGGILFLFTATFTSQRNLVNISNSLFSRNLAAVPAIRDGSHLCVDGLFNVLTQVDITTQIALPSAGALTLIFQRSVDDSDGIVDVRISNTTFFLNSGVCFGAVLALYQDDPEHGVVNIDGCTFEDNVPLLLSSLYDNYFASDVTAYTRYKDSSRSDTVLSITESEFYTKNISNTPYISVVQFSSSNVEALIYLGNLVSNVSQQFLYATALGPGNVGIYMQDIVVNNTIPERQLDLFVQESGIFTFVNVGNVVLNGSQNGTCFFRNIVGSVFTASSSELHFTGTVEFSYNSASQGSNGAAIAMRSGSHLWLKEPLVVYLVNNSAIYGGAIYSVAQGGIESPTCVFQYETQQIYSMENISSIDIKIYLVHNSASLGGNSVYADYLYNCVFRNRAFTGITSGNIPLIYDAIFNNVSFPPINGNQEISSTPKQLCICDADTQNTTTSEIQLICGSQGIDTVMNMTTYPGARFTLLLLTVDDIRSAVYSPIVSSISSTEDLSLEQEQNIIEVGPNCTYVEYSVTTYTPFVSDMKEGMLAINPLSTSQGSLIISIQVLQCPVGFQQSGDQGGCVCINLLTDYGIQCDIDSGLFTLPSNSAIWAGIVEQNKTSGEATIGVSLYCTTRYCTELSVYNISDSGAVCQGNRRGVLCGSCKEGYSAVVGDPDCKKCNNISLLTLLVYVVAGVVLVVFLFLLRLTVNSGTIHGLIFYANLFQINTYVFLGPSYVQWLVVFISFLNLNLGFPLCLYDGMTTIVKRYLEILFVLYLWGIAISLIVWSKYSSKLSKLISRSAVPVLATLFQLSFSKLLYIVVSVLAYSNLDLEEPDGTRSSKTVWYYDGTVGYLEGQHAALFVFVLLILLLFVTPYTIILTGVKVLSRYRIINRFMPLIDTYTAPYKDKYRFWFGGRLCVLITIYIFFAILRDYPLALILVQALILILFVCIQSSVMPFKDRIVNILDLFYVVNATILSVFALYFTSTEVIAKVSAVLMGMVFVVFWLVILYHIWLVLGCRCKIPNRMRAMMKISRSKQNTTDLHEPIENKEQYTDYSYDSTRLRVSYIEDNAEQCD